jgi:hypothetical protein
MPGLSGPRRRRGLRRLGVALAIACAPSLAVADDDESPKAGQSSNPFYALDTKNLFGFLEGADVGEKGDRSLEFETTGSFGEAQGLYRSIEQEFIFENTLTDSLGLELGAHVLGQNIRRASDLPDFAGLNFMGVSAEFRYVVMHRTADVPIQVTLTVQPEYNSIAEAGRQANDVTATFRGIADMISSDRRLYGAVNLVYAPDASRLPKQLWEDTALLAASAALSYRLTPPLIFGAERTTIAPMAASFRGRFKGKRSISDRRSIIRSTKRSICPRPSSPKRRPVGSTSTNSRASSPS